MKVCKNIFDIHNTNKKYKITSMRISGETVGTARTNYHTARLREIEVELTIIVPNPEDLQKANTDDDPLHTLENFLVSPYDWCSSKMVYEALREKFPERFL